MQRAMSLRRTGALTVLMLTALAAAACSDWSTPKPAPVVDPNLLPPQYQLQIVRFLRTELTDPADYHGALISQIAMKPVGSSNHYVVCLRFNGNNVGKEKVVIFLAGNITQFITPTPQLCGDAQYQPFHELESAGPS